MRLRSLAVLAAAGLFVVPAFSQQSSPPTAPIITPPRAVTPPKPCDATCPAMALPSSRNLEVEASELQQAREDWHGYWMNNQPSILTYERLVVKSYAVADLIVPPPPAGGCCAFATDKVTTCERELIKKITTAIEPKSWTCAGGRTGSIEYYPLGMALVINHTPEVQAAVARYLDSLRKLPNHQVCAEICLVTVSDDWFAKSELAKKFCPCDTGGVARSATLMSADDIRKVLQSAKQDGAISVLTAPTLTTLNGQSGCVRVGNRESFVTSLTAKTVRGDLVFIPNCDEQEMGVQLTLEPMICDDGKVNMSVSGTVREHAVLPVPMTPLTTAVAPVSLTTAVTPVKEKSKSGEPVSFTQYIQDPKILTRTITDAIGIPDGGSAVFYGGRGTIEETVKERLPTLSDVPVLADLFAKDKKVTTTNHLLVVITPHILRPEPSVEQCSACCPQGKLGKLMADYKRACRDGKVDEARRLAIQCLAIDATCFGAK